MPALALHEPASSARVRLHVARGLRPMQEMLLDEIDALIPPGALDPALLAAPIRIIVPSRSMRHHVCGALVRRRGRSLIGVAVHTLHGLALELLDRVSAELPASAALYDVLVRRHAREEPVLRASLEPLVDGYAAVSGAVRDLLDAGLEEALTEGAVECLEGAAGLTDSERARAGALVAVAARTAEDMERFGIGRTGVLYKRAQAALGLDPEGALPTRRVIFYGFSGVTALSADLIQQLLSAFSGSVYINLPRDPAHPTRHDLGVGATARLFARLGQDMARVLAPPKGQPPETEEFAQAQMPAIDLLNAKGAWEEAREVAHRARALIDSGVSPERLAIAARDLRVYRVPLRLHLRRLGVPFSGLGALGPPGGVGRRIHALLDLVRRQADSPVDRWLDAQGPPHRLGGVEARSLRSGPLFDLRLALRSLGAARVSDVAALDLEDVLGGRASLPLPTRRGVWEAEPSEGSEEDQGEGDGKERATVRRRHLHGEVLQRAIRGAAILVERFTDWPSHAALPDHVRTLRRLLVDLGWTVDVPSAVPVFGAVAALEREFPGRVPLSFDEFSLLLSRSLFDIGAEPIGGQGAGVAVLSAREARGLTFDHLFVLGCNRDGFPKPAREDPMLTDAARRALREVFPELPVRGDGLAEERLLFAELLSAAPALTLSWQAVDDDGKERAPSPLVDRLRWSKGESEIQLITALYDSTSPPPATRVLPIEDHVLLAAIHGGRAGLAAIFGLAIGDAPDARSSGVMPDPRRVAAARLAVLDEVDPDQRTREGRARRQRLGPYFGFIGPGKRDTLRTDISITTVERMARCPWQAFVERLLHLEVPPDPMENLPGIDGLMVGNVVHRTLQRVAGADPDGVAPRLADLAELVGSPLRWPSEADLEIMLQAEASDVLRESGIGLAGFSRALVAQARPYLEQVRASDAAAGSLDVVAAEAEGVVHVTDQQGKNREIQFRVDRVDRQSGRLWLTDYKTGSLSGALKRKAADKRRSSLLDKVRSGELLQAVAYAVGGAESLGAQTGGRYLFLKPDIDDEMRSVQVSSDETDFAEAFQDVSRRTLAAWDEGSFFPRLVNNTDDDTPAACRWCRVREACNYGDSGARARLRSWVERSELSLAAGEALSTAEAAALDVWNLGRTPVEEK